MVVSGTVTGLVVDGYSYQYVSAYGTYLFVTNVVGFFMQANASEWGGIAVDTECVGGEDSSYHRRPPRHIQAPSPQRVSAQPQPTPR